MPGEFGKPLITQNTDLKSLKYTTVYESGQTVGKDPYVTKKIPGHRFEEGPNGLIEAVVDPIPSPKASSILGARADDLKRLTKVIKEKSVKFTTNQALLGNSPKEIALIIGSTLAQAPVNGTGTHFTHGFVKDTYLNKDISQRTALGRFIAETLNVNSINGASQALVGKTIIPDNDGQVGYRPHRDSDLQKLNSKYDLKNGADDFSSTLLDKLRVNPYVDTLARGIGSPTAQRVIGKAGDLLKGIFGKKKQEKVKGLPTNLGSIFKVKGDNLGQEGFQPMTPSLLINDEADEIHDTIQSNLKGPKNPPSLLSTGADDLDGRPLIKGGAKRVVRENDGGRGFTPQGPDFLSKKESEQTINVNGKAESIRPEFTLKNERPGYQTPNQLPDYIGKNKDGFNQTEHHSAGTEAGEASVELSNFSAGLNPTGPSLTGRTMPQIGPDGYAEGEFKTFVDDEGGVTGVITREYDPNNPSQLKMYLQDQPGITESEDLKTELGGVVSSGNTNTSRITKMIDFRKVRKWGVNAGVHGKTESIGPDSNGYTSTTDSELLPDYSTQQVGVRLKYSTEKGQSDYVNATDVIDASIEDSFIQATENYFEGFDGDIIPFEFNILTPTAQKFLFFRAFLDDFSDNYTGDWNGQRFVGRAEEFYTYQGFSRDISFSFKVAAFSKQELVPLYKKLNTLVGSTAPTYDANGHFMRGTLCTLSLGHYLDRQDGFITKVGLTWQKGYPWEIDLFQENLPKVPTILDVSVSFTPIHDFNVKSDIDIVNRGEMYFGANLTSRPRVDTVNTVAPRPVTTNTRPQAEIPKIPKTEPVATPVVPKPTAPLPSVSQKIETPTIQTGTVNPTTNLGSVSFKELSRDVTLSPSIPPKYVATIEIINQNSGKTGTGKAVNTSENLAIATATARAQKNAK